MAGSTYLFIDLANSDAMLAMLPLPILLLKILVGYWLLRVVRWLVGPDSLMTSFLLVLVRRIAFFNRHL
jgi:hypothetical protein